MSSIITHLHKNVCISEHQVLVIRRSVNQLEMNKQNVLKITHSNSASGDLMKLVQGSRCTLLKLTRQCMVPVHGLNSLKSCSQTSEYFHKILETLQMPNMKVKLLQRLTFSSSRFAER